MTFSSFHPLHPAYVLWLLWPNGTVPSACQALAWAVCQPKPEQELNESPTYGERQLEAGQVNDSLLVLLSHGRLFMAVSFMLLWTTNKGQKILGHLLVTPGRWHSSWSPGGARVVYRVMLWQAHALKQVTSHRKPVIHRHINNFSWKLQ